MTKEQIEFLSKPEVREHFMLVIEHNQNFQRSHDIAKPVLELCEDVLKKPVAHCEGCVQEAYKEIEAIYQNKKPNDKNETITKKSSKDQDASKS